MPALRSAPPAAAPSPQGCLARAAQPAGWEEAAAADSGGVEWPDSGDAAAGSPETRAKPPPELGGCGGSGAAAATTPAGEDAWSADWSSAIAMSRDSGDRPGTRSSGHGDWPAGPAVAAAAAAAAAAEAGRGRSHPNAGYANGFPVPAVPPPTRLGGPLHEKAADPAAGAAAAGEDKKHGVPNGHAPLCSCGGGGVRFEGVGMAASAAAAGTATGGELPLVPAAALAPS